MRKTNRTDNPTTMKAKLLLSPLEDRCNPSASLLDVNNTLQGAANKPSNILGQSANGRYVIFESTGTDVVQNQSDIPNTKDLFWSDLLKGETRMVTSLPAIDPTGTSYDYVSARNQPTSFSTFISGGATIINSFNRAVISEDGSTVAFSSILNAGRLDVDVASTRFLPGSPNSTKTTDSDSTNDVFRWSSVDGSILLASRTRRQGGATGQAYAFGAFGSADEPAITSDGTIVGFVSAVDAKFSNPTIDASGTASTGYMISDNSISRDIFLAGFEVDVQNRARFLNSSVITAFGSASEDFPPMFDAVTFGIGNSSGQLNVDPLGRYLSSDGSQVHVVFTSNNKLQHASMQQDLTGDFGGVTIRATNSITNAIVAVNDPTTVLFTRNDTAAPVNNGLFYQRDVVTNIGTQFPETKLNKNGTFPIDSAAYLQYDISPSDNDLAGKVYIVFQASGTVFFLNDDSITSQVSLSNTASLTLSGNDVKRISNVVTTADTPRVSQNGRFVTFQSQTIASQVTGNNSISDTNLDVNFPGSGYDVFLADQYASKSGTTYNIGTRLISVNSAGTASGNGRSLNAFVGSDFKTPFTGSVLPDQPDDSRGFVAFNSKATTLDAQYPPTHLGTATYFQQLPIGGLNPPETKVTRNSVVSGGQQTSFSGVSFTNGVATVGDRFTPYPGFTGEVRVARGDVDGDGIDDFITAPGAGAGPRVRVFSGLNQKVLYDFFAFEKEFRGGVTVATGDINKDGKFDVVLGADKGGGARVRVLDLANTVTLADYFAYSSAFRGGVRVATGDVNADGFTDVITGAGDGGGPRVTVFSGKDITGYTDASTSTVVPRGSVNRIIDFFAAELNLRNGVYVAGGDINGDGYAEIVVGSGPGGGPRVTAFDGFSTTLRPDRPDRLYDFFAGSTDDRSGVRVAVKNVNGDSTADIVTASGTGTAGRIRTYLTSTLANINIGNTKLPLVPDEANITFTVYNDTGNLNGAWVG